MVAPLVVVPFSTTTSSTSQWACAYGVGLCLRPADKGLIFTLAVSCPFNSVLLLWQERLHGKKMQGQAIKLSVVFQFSLGLPIMVRMKVILVNIYPDVG